jgi:hypothetical protein
VTARRSVPGDSEHHEPDDPAELTIPAWVPRTVAEQAAAMWTMWARFPALAEHVPAIVRFRRLVCDKRMLKVWRELQRRKRDGTGFVNPARGSGDLQSEEDRQQQAMSYLFIFVTGYLNPALEVRTRADMETEERRAFRAIEQLRKAATDVLPFAPERSREINAIADALQAEIGVGFPSRVSALIVERNRSDPQVQALVRMVADTCRRFFGSPLYSTVATIANVALDRNDLTVVRVRNLIGR